MKKRMWIKRRDDIKQRYWIGKKLNKIRAFMRSDPQELIAYKRFGKHNLKQLPRLGRGSDREVFALGKDKVIKIARTPRGLAQNEQERGLSDYFLPDDKKLNVFETGKDYVIAERAERNDKELRKFLKPLQRFHIKDFKEKTGELQDAMDKLGLGDYLNYDLAWGDFQAARNWGLVKGNPSLIDGEYYQKRWFKCLRESFIHPINKNGNKSKEKEEGSNDKKEMDYSQSKKQKIQEKSLEAEA